MLIVHANTGVCEGYANCVIAADDYFDLSEDGVVRTIQIQISPLDLARVEAAVNACPVSALSLENLP